MNTFQALTVCDRPTSEAAVHFIPKLCKKRANSEKLADAKVVFLLCAGNLRAHSTRSAAVV